MRNVPTGRLLAVLPFLAACAGGSGSGADGPPALAYSMSAADVTYSQNDSTVMSIDAGGQLIDVVILADGVLDMGFAPTADGVRVTTTWRDLDIEMTNPMGAPERATEDDIDGPLVFDMDRRGNTEMISAPALEGRARQMVAPKALAESFFPRLPGTAPTPGMTWTDTISFEAEVPEASTVTNMILDYTVVGDTLVDGRPLLRIDLQGRGSTLQEGNTQGMDFLQDLAGDVSGMILWDLAAGAMHYQRMETEYAGSMEVSAAPVPLEVAMRGVSHTRRTPED